MTLPSGYDAWRTDPDYGLTHRDMREREERQERICAAVDEAAAIRAELRDRGATIVEIADLIDRLAAVGGCGPRYSWRWRDQTVTGHAEPADIDTDALRAFARADDGCRKADEDRMEEG